MTASHRSLIWLLVFLACEAALFLWVDQPVAAWARELDQTHPGLINFFRAITDAGKSKWYLWPAAAGICIAFAATRLPILSITIQNCAARLAHHLVFFFSSVALSGIVTDIIKPILGRARPVEWVREQIYGFHPFTFHASMNSMPSGHTTTAAALATVLTLLYSRGHIAWWGIAILLAVSRVMVNAHYVSDVAAGFLVGFLTTYAISRARNPQGMFPQLNGIFPIDKKPPVS